jgi:hypothetical protein
MAEEVYKYQVWCDTDEQYETVWSETAPTTCPADPSGHTIDQSKTTIIEELGENHVILDMASIDNPSLPVQRVAIQPGRSGYRMCDRDFLVKTAQYAAEDSFEDLKVNTSSNKEDEWNELSFIGCYKEENGSIVPCTDQTDADSNACISIWDYVANNQVDGTPIDFDLKGGAFWVDDSVADDANRWKHKLYVMLAPNIPSSFGGRVRFFDGYLYPYKDDWMVAINTMAYEINPSVTVEAARMRIWVYYPAGTKLEHILRLVTYRPTGSMENDDESSSSSSSSSD